MPINQEAKKKRNEKKRKRKEKKKMTINDRQSVHFSSGTSQLLSTCVNNFGKTHALSHILAKINLEKR